MPYPLRSITVTDETGTNYTDLFADLDLDAFDLIGANGIRAVDATIPNATFSPRGNEEAPLGALIVRWIQAHIDRPSDRFGWQYLDAADIHTVAFVDDDDELRFINIFGQVDGGRRVYRLRALAEALGLLVEFQLHEERA